MESATCLCGKVSIQVKEIQHEVGACHCSMCRKWGSGPLLTIEAGTTSDIIIHNEQFVSRYQSSEWAERGFCSHCGSNLFYHYYQQTHIVSLLIYLLIRKMQNYH